MFEEAFEIYKKFGLKTKAIKVLLEQMEDLSRAQEYATKVHAHSWRLNALPYQAHQHDLRNGHAGSF